jgi:mono/diheme cytochrome c family protein
VRRDAATCGARLVLAGWLFAAAAAQGAPLGEADELARGRAALRAMDCARCHGRDYDGWAAPSLVAAVRDAPRERFDRFVLDGNIGAGMPGYRGQPLVVRELDAMYAYLKARAKDDTAAR